MLQRKYIYQQEGKSYENHRFAGCKKYSFGCIAKEQELSAEKGAAKFNRKDYAARIAELKKYITERASDISKRMNTEMVDDSSEIALEIDSVFEKWEQLAENFDEEHFYYGEKFLIKEPDDGEGRLMKPFNTSRNDPAFDTMTSMRNVDSTVAGNVLIWEEV